MDKIITDIDYETFIEIIKTIPSCIFYKDKDLRYKFSTHFWEQLITDNVIGKTDIEIRKDKENAILAMETDQNIIRTKKGCNYVIKSEIDGNISYLELIKEPVLNKRGEVKGIVGLINDITEEVNLQKKVRELATKDMLTGLFNRQAGTNAIQLSLDNCKKNKAFCLIDIDKFKLINDTYGHQVGDKVLENFGKIIQNTIYNNDIAMRLGGDEFIILLKNISNEQQVKDFIKKLYENVENINIEELEDKITISVGVK